MGGEKERKLWSGCKINKLNFLRKNMLLLRDSERRMGGLHGEGWKIGVREGIEGVTTDTKGHLRGYVTTNL